MQKNRSAAKMEIPMARPRIPTAVLELRGAFKNHPSRLKDRKYEPLVSTSLPEPPTSIEAICQINVVENQDLRLLADERRQIPGRDSSDNDGRISRRSTKVW
jgi:hypothetical protein